MTARRCLHVALMGARGIPASYGGYETLFEELAPRLVDRGFEVTVYCRSHHTPGHLAEHKGARLVVLPTLRTKHLDTPVHTLVSALHAARRPYDAALMVNAANALFVPLVQLGGTPVALHVDGIERQRAKWGRFGRGVYTVSERLACTLPDLLVSDAEVIRQHYRRQHHTDSTLITYGIDPHRPATTAALERFGLEPRRYFLYVSRFEPENNPHRVVEAYRLVGGDLPLVMVGSAPYATEFIDEVHRLADERVRFPGPVYGVGYRELLSHTFASIHATEVGGTHPALVEAMGYGACVVVNATPENREVAGDAGLYFDAHDPPSLARILERLRADPEAAATYGEAAAALAAERFDWERIADAYAAMFRRMAARA